MNVSNPVPATIRLLPTELLLCVCEHLMCTDLLKLELTERDIRAFLCSPDSSAAWRSFCSNVWSIEIGLGVYGSWRDAAINLERRVYPILCDFGVKPALRSLRLSKQAPPRSPHTSEFANHCTLDVLRNTLKHRTHLDCRRRAALFACSSSFAGAAPIVCQPRSHDKEGDESSSASSPTRVPLVDELSNLLPILSDFRVIKEARDPEDALRQLLLQFPFLPLDAGEGADRVIKALARVYLNSHPEEYVHLSKEDLRPGEERHDDAESAVYILIYAVIMLNTDLHNRRIRHKMRAPEFVRSTQSTVLGSAYSEADLLRIYSSVASQPLRICSLDQQHQLSNLLDARTRQQAAVMNRVVSGLPSRSGGGWSRWARYFDQLEGNLLQNQKSTIQFTLFFLLVAMVAFEVATSLPKSAVPLSLTFLVA